MNCFGSGWSPLMLFLFFYFSNFVVLDFPKVGHTKGYVQVLVIAPEGLLGTSAIVKITSVGRWSVFGEVIEIVNQPNNKTATNWRVSSEHKCSSLSDPYKPCSCSGLSESCACGPESCRGQQSNFSKRELLEDQSKRNLAGWFLRKRNNLVRKKIQSEKASGVKKQEQSRGSTGEWDFIDRVLLGGMLVSSFTVIILLIYLYITLLSK